MPIYHCKAVSSAGGDVIEEEIEASSEDEVVYAIRQRGYLPISIESDKNNIFGSLFRLRGKQKKDIKGQKLIFFCRELGTLINAGMPLDRALFAISELVQAGDESKWIEDVISAVKDGASLSGSIEQVNIGIPKYLIGLIKAGEASGELGTILLRTSEFLEKSEDLKDSVRSALIYPCALMVIAFLSLIVLVTFVVPQFAELFADAGKALPLPTQIVVAVGAFFASYWWLLCLFIAGILSAIKKVLSYPKIRLAWDDWCLRVWLVGELITKIEVARFSRTLGALVVSGIPLLSAIRLSSDVLVNTRFADSIDTLVTDVEQGSRMTQSLSKAACFPKLAIHMIGIGEESGRLGETLASVSNTYEKEVHRAISRLLALLEPVLILGLGLVVSGIILSILIAILDVNELVV